MKDKFRVRECEMQNGMSHEITMTIPMVFAAIWTAITGDTLVPSFAGGAFATYFRLEKSESDNPVTVRDIAFTFIASVVIGVIAGPYVGDQLPEGDGVVGVGALIASFLGTAFLQKIDRMDWDMGAFFKMLADSFHRKK